MKPQTFLLYLGLILTQVHTPYAIAQVRRGKNREASPRTVLASQGKLPLSFEANQGQTDSSVKFLSRGPGYTLFLTATEAVLRLRQTANLPDLSKRTALETETALRMRLLGSNPSAQVTGREELPAKSNYFLGNDPRQWRTNVATYAKVRYEGVYPGIDLVYYGNQRALEFDFIVAPGSDVTAIEISFQGADQLAVEEQGHLSLQVEGAQMILRHPALYQQFDGVRKEVAGGYRLLGPDKIGFQVGDYDPTEPLIIDPVFLLYSTYLGGFDLDEGWDIAVASDGSIFLTGQTNSLNFPTKAPLSVGGGFARGFDAFVLKLNAAGSALVYSTYLGGGGSDLGQGIAVDAQGNAYVTGRTASRDFPQVNALQTDFGGGVIGDVFVSKLNPAGSQLVYSRYIGGSDDEAGNAIAVDSAGNAYITGFTRSLNFPTANPSQSFFRGGSADAFLTKLNAAGNLFVFSTFLGGSQADNSFGLDVDASGNAYLTGSTESPDFPAFANLQPGFGGLSDAFVGRFDSSGELLFLTYLGGSSRDEGRGIVAKDPGNVYVAGFTASADFPTVRAPQSVFGGGTEDAFVAKLNLVSLSAGNALPYSTYLGGSGADSARDITLDGSGNIYVTGFTDSLDFPLAGAFQTSPGGNGDAFVTKLDFTSNFVVLPYSTYLGGTATDIGLGIAVDASRNAYVTGWTESGNFPITVGSLQINSAGGVREVFFTKVGSNPLPTLSSLSPASLTAGGAAFTLTVNGSGFVSGSVIRWNGSDRSTTFVSPAKLTALMAANDIATSGTAAVTVFNPPPEGGTSNSLPFTIVKVVTGPSISPAGVVNNASYTFAGSSVAPGSIAAIFGSNLTDGSSCLSPSCGPTFGSNGRLNTTLAGAQVTVNGTLVPIYYASPTRLGIQIPTELTTTSATVQVSVGGQASAPATVVVEPVSPGLFSANADGQGPGAVTHADGSPVTPQNPARRGEVVVFYATGLGPVSPAVATGALASGESRTVAEVLVTVEGIPVEPDFAGLSGCCVGLNQVNVRIPDRTRSANDIPVVLTIGGKRSNTVTLAVP